MKLVQRFIDFTHWPSSRKLLLLGCLSLPATFAAGLVNHYFNVVAPQHPTVDNRLLDPLVEVWLGVQVVATLLSVPAARAGREARPLIYVYVFLQAPFIVGILHLYGTMSTPFVAIVPTIVILWAFYFGERVAWFGLALFLVLILAVHGLESAGLLTYAPILLDRSIDAQGSTVWFTATLIATIILFAFSFSMTLLVLSARRWQEARLREAHTELERSSKLIRRYVPSQLAEQIIAGHYVETAKPERRKLTICFTDIQGFTLASDELDAEELAALLNEYLSAMVAVADRYGATVNQLVGDGMMIFFGAPHATNDKDHALRAVHMALEMQRHMCELQAGWTQRGLQRPFRIRIGINTGYASVGDYGSEGRKLYSGIGVQTNLAARIQARCEPGKVLISHTTRALVEDEILCIARDEIEFRGIHHPVKVYEVAETNVSPATIFKFKAQDAL